MKTGQHPAAWRARLAAAGWKPDTVLCMAHLLSESVDRAVRPGLSPEAERRVAEHEPPVDWAHAYQAAPAVLGDLVRSLEPTFAPRVPEADQSLGGWLRQTMQQVEAVIRKLDRVTDPKTGMVSAEGMQTNEMKALQRHVEGQVDQIRVEFKAAVDTLLAVLLWRQPMSQLVTAAESGDDTALLRALQVNRSLVHRPGITGQIQQAIQRQDHRFLQRLAQHLAHRPTVQKHAKVGFVLLVLWEAGLKRLTYKQIRGFLKTAGLQTVPTHQALERYAERLGLTKYYRVPRDHERSVGTRENQ